MKKQSYVLWFNQIQDNHISLVGDKASRLSKLSQLGFTVPAGFVLTSQAFQDTIASNKKIKSDIDDILSRTDIHDSLQIQTASNKIKDYIKKLHIEKQLALKVFEI